MRCLSRGSVLRLIFEGSQWTKHPYDCNTSEGILLGLGLT